jgi:hypothetical protein
MEISYLCSPLLMEIYHIAFGVASMGDYPAAQSVRFYYLFFGPAF